MNLSNFSVSLLDSALQYSAHRDQVEATREQNRKNFELAQYQNDWNLQQWHRQNQFNIQQRTIENRYNSPVEQMRRLREAGLNPHLVYGNGNAVSPSGQTRSSSSPTASPVHYQAYQGYTQDVNNMVNGLFQGARFLEELQSIKENNRLARLQQQVAESEVLKKNVETSLVLSQTARNRFDLDLARDLRDVTKLQAKANLNSTYAQTANTDYDSLKKQTERAIMVLNSKLTKEQLKQMPIILANLKVTGHNLSYEAKRKMMENEMIKQGINPNDPILYRIAGRALLDTEFSQELIKNLGTNIPKIINQFELTTEDIIKNTLNTFGRRTASVLRQIFK